MWLSVFCEHHHNLQCVFSGYRSEVDENCTLLGYYIACNDNSLPTFLEQPVASIFKGVEKLSRNVGKEELPLRSV